MAEKNPKSFDATGEELDKIEKAEPQTKKEGDDAYNEGARASASWVEGMSAALKKGFSKEEAKAIGDVFREHRKSQEKKKKSPLYDNPRSKK